MEKKQARIICAGCGRESFLVRTPIYKGIVPVGEKLACAACGHVYAGEQEVAFQHTRAPKVLGEIPGPRPPVDLFRDGAETRTCRHCSHYLVNPFTQRCGLHGKAVEATDTCPDFEVRKEKPGSAADAGPQGAPPGGKP